MPPPGRSPSYMSLMSPRLRVIGTILAAVVAASALLRADSGSGGLKVEPRIVEATLGHPAIGNTPGGTPTADELRAPLVRAL